MRRKTFVILSAAFALAIPLGTASAVPPSGIFQPGAPGAGDPYFPLDGNGGYDVGHYKLDIAYHPANDRLIGVATITAVATQNLSSFNLDFDGLVVRSITVNGVKATWSRGAGELTVSPASGLRAGRRFIAIVRYDGVPETLEDGSGFIHTDDGAVIIGEPAVASTWFPVNDHPIDKAAYTFQVTVPRGREAVANGVLRSRRETSAGTTWTWVAEEPMASYLATATMGEFDLNAYTADGIRYWDAIDPDLFDKAEPRTGEQMAYTQRADSAYKRLLHPVSVPAGGADLSFWVHRDTETDWDFAFVEVHTVGGDDWTTLPDTNGHTSQDTGAPCPSWLELHPHLAHYQTADGDECTPSGSTGEWHAASGGSDGWEQWAVDLSAYAGTDVEVAISYASDQSVQGAGVFVDDVVVSTGPGTTSFEDDGDALDGWTVPGPPEGSPGNDNDWIVATTADVPPSTGDIIEGTFARQPEITGFLADRFGPYPFSASGGIVDDSAAFGFALENQTRPIYAKTFFGDSIGGDSVVVHELAHQWYGDSLALERWQHIWLNEGFASYAEWLWSEEEGLGTAQEIFDNFYGIPADDEFWDLTIGDPGPDHLFAGEVYARGAMTLHALRLEVGDEDFFQILRDWASSQAGGNVTTAEFVALAEQISGQQLDELFQDWLFATDRPGLSSVAARSSAGSVDAPTPAVVRSLHKRLGKKAGFTPR